MPGSCPAPRVPVVHGASPPSAHTAWPLGRWALPPLPSHLRTQASSPASSARCRVRGQAPGTGKARAAWEASPGSQLFLTYRNLTHRSQMQVNDPQRRTSTQNRTGQSPMPGESWDLEPHGSLRTAGSGCCGRALLLEGSPVWTPHVIGSSPGRAYPGCTSRFLPGCEERGRALFRLLLCPSQDTVKSALPPERDRYQPTADCGWLPAPSPSSLAP